MALRINIMEQDITSTPVSISDTDIVFVPGLSIEPVGNSNPPKRYEPVLCSDVATFRKNFGTKPVIFKNQLSYPSAAIQTTTQSFTAADVSEGVSQSEFVCNNIIESVTQVKVGSTVQDAGDYSINSKVVKMRTPVQAGTNVSIKYTYRPAHAFSTDAIPSGGVMFKAEDPDPSWIYAESLLSMGLKVMYCRINDYTVLDEDGKWNTESVEDVYTCIDTLYGSDTNLPSRGDFQFKYLTTGGYPIYEYDNNSIASRMLGICAKRGDAIALIDHTDNPDRPLMGNGSVIQSLNTIEDGPSEQNVMSTNGSYGAMFTPWGIYTTSSYLDGLGSASQMSLPGSFGYLSCLADSLNNNNYNWMIISGVTRGKVPNLRELHTNYVLTNAIADYYQSYGEDVTGTSVQINPITNIRPYGLCIWGNRTLRNNGEQDYKALSYLNLRSLICDVKKQAYIACRNLMFEQNTSVLWTNFKSYLTPLLDQMKSGQGIAEYQIIRNASDKPTKVNASIKLWPIYGVESFDITVYMTDEDITFTDYTAMQ